MQFSIINDGRGGITLTASGKEDAAILARLPECIELRRTEAGYAWVPAPVVKAPRVKDEVKAATPTDEATHERV